MVAKCYPSVKDVRGNEVEQAAVEKGLSGRGPAGARHGVLGQCARQLAEHRPAECLREDLDFVAAEVQEKGRKRLGTVKTNWRWGTA